VSLVWVCPCAGEGKKAKRQKGVEKRETRIEGSREESEGKGLSLRGRVM